jgi:hypothetical protein
MNIGDNIRASNELLAEELSENKASCDYCLYELDLTQCGDCKQGILERLNQEVKD